MKLSKQLSEIRIQVIYSYESKDRKDEIVKWLDEAIESSKQLQARNAELEAENKELREALEKYGVHKVNCIANMTGTHKHCNCGLDQALQK